MADVNEPMTAPSAQEATNNEEKAKKDIENANYLYSHVLSLTQGWKSIDVPKAELIIEYAKDAVELYGKTNHEKKTELKRLIEKAEQVIPPDSIDSLKKRGERFVLRIVYPRNQKVRNVLLSVIGVVLIGSILSTSVIALRTFFPAKKQLSEGELKEKNYQKYLGDQLVTDYPQLALPHYDEALKLDPDDEELKKKVEQLREKLMKGSPR